MDEELDVVVIGFDVERRQAEAGLMHVFGIEPHSARRLVRDLPMVAKRQASRTIAEHYVAALRSIGARVEIRRADVNAINQTSLPAPLPSALAGMRESFRVDREADSAIARFRAAEGLDAVERSEDGVDLFNPDIPKAPLLPHDLARMPNAALPHFTDPPGGGDVSFDPGPSDGARSSDPRGGSAQREPTSRDVAFLDSATVPKSEDPLSVRPGAVGLVHGASVSGRPAPGPISSWPRPAATAARPPQRKRWLMLGTVVLVLVIGLRLWGAFATHRRLDAWQHEGIDPGSYALATKWLADQHHSLPGMSQPAGLQLVERLRTAGAVEVYAIRIRMIAGGEQAEGLIVELPDIPEARRALLEQAAQPRPGSTAETDHGQHFAVVAFP